MDQAQPPRRSIKELNVKSAWAISFVLVLAGCSPEQSQNIGAQPKKTVDKVSTDISKAMRQGQGSERLKEEEPK